MELIAKSIEADLGPNDLCALSRTSRSLQWEAERHLYRHLLVRNVSQTIKMCKRMSSSPRLGKHVRSFAVTMMEQRHYPTPIIFYTFFTLISSSLQNMTQLKRLDLLFCNRFGPVPSKFLSIFCHRFRFELVHFETDSQVDRNAISFFRQQPSIQSLRLSSLYPHHSERLVIPPASLPNLTILEAGAELVNLLLRPSRPLTHVMIRYCRRSFLQNIVPLHTITALCTDLWQYRSSSFGYRLLGAYFPNLEFLGGIGITNAMASDNPCLRCVLSS
jgi:hypothetical protein